MSFPNRSARSPSASLELFSRNLSLSAGTFFIQQAGGPVNGYVATGGTHLAKLGGLVLGLGVGQADAQASFARLIATPSLATLPLATSTRIALADPESVLRLLCAHPIEHEAVIAEQVGTTVIVLDASRARIDLFATARDITVEAPDVAALQEMRLTIASHVVEFARQDSRPEML